MEVERRFLVRTPLWRSVGHGEREHINQFYLAADPDLAVRVRVTGDRAVLTVKGRAEGAAREEIETDIDIDAAREMMATGLYRGVVLSKSRSTIVDGGLTIEVDEFAGDNAGLVIAEIEFRGGPGEREAWESKVNRDRPSWLGREITGDHRYANSQLALRPFGDWPAEERDAVLRELSEPA